MNMMILCTTDFSKKEIEEIYSNAAVLGVSPDEFIRQAVALLVKKTIEASN